ncbi:protein big brother-like protein, partial [Dinothrombium tinctorium]
MLPFEAPTIFEQLPRFIFKMPRVVQDQKSKFETDELFRRLSRESEVRCSIDFDVDLFSVRYTGYRDRPLDERQIRFQNSVREGHAETAFITTGTNLQLVFNPCVNGYNDSCDFDKEHGK